MNNKHLLSMKYAHMQTSIFPNEPVLEKGVETDRVSRQLRMPFSSLKEAACSDQNTTRSAMRRNARTAPKPDDAPVLQHTYKVATNTRARPNQPRTRHTTASESDTHFACCSFACNIMAHTQSTTTRTTYAVMHVKIIRNMSYHRA